MITSCQEKSQEIATPDQEVPVSDALFAKYLQQAEETAAKMLDGTFSDKQDPLQFVSGGIDGNTTWTSDRVWVMTAPVIVGSGETLTIEAGTIVKSFPGQAGRAVYLIVAPGGQLVAEGTVDAPIIFTSVADRVELGQTVVENAALRLPAAARGLWGGVLMLGNAPTNAVGDQNLIEGIRPGSAVGGEEVPVAFGGSDTTDNSGILTYVSIRHGGTVIGDLAAGNEINGLTMGGVGSGTTIDFVEVFANRDDGFEWFGGTVNTKHLIANFCGDDHFDWDLGFAGKGQFWFSWQDITGDRAGEHDGGVGSGECGEPLSTPVLANVTYAGDIAEGTDIAQLRDNSGGQYWRGFYYNFAGGFEIEETGAGIPCSSIERLAAGDLAFVRNYFADIQSANFAQVGVDPQDLDPDAFAVNVELELDGTTRLPVVPNDLPLLSEDGLMLMDFFEDTTYPGAFDPTVEPWVFGWTAWENYYLNPGTPGGPPTGTESPE